MTLKKKDSWVSPRPEPERGASKGGFVLHKGHNLDLERNQEKRWEGEGKGEREK